MYLAVLYKRNENRNVEHKFSLHASMTPSWIQNSKYYVVNVFKEFWYFFKQLQGQYLSHKNVLKALICVP